jgi:hypothetical protein
MHDMRKAERPECYGISDRSCRIKDAAAHTHHEDNTLSCYLVIFLCCWTQVMRMDVVRAIEGQEGV